MKNLILASVFLITIVFSVEKCGFNNPQIDQYRGLANCTNISMQKTILSPSGFFYVHFDTTDVHSPDLMDINPLDGIPDYINEVSEVADSSYRLLREQMNFKDGSNGSDNITDIFVLELDGSAYGWARPINSCYDSCIEIDNNYEESEYYTNGIDAMKVTLLHEYFHTIQFAYRCSPGINSYFYELTSTWIEDVGYPEINDYLNFMVSSNSYKNYYKYPQQDFDNTNGYSVALFGHYLSTQLEGNNGITHQDELSSMVMNEIWDRIDNTSHTAISCIDYVLEYEYNSTFNELWVDFNSRNLFNQINEDMYYYEDQALIEKINIDDFTVIDFNSYNISLGLDYKSVTIPSFGLENRGKVDINITANDDLLLGNMVVLSDLESSLVPLYSGDSPILNEEDIIYFVFGTDENYLSINLNLDPLYVPSKPDDIFSLIGLNFVDIWWDHSDDYQEGYQYNIFRDGILLDTIIDSFYFDNDIVSGLEYFYEVTAQNEIGSSNPLSITIDTSVPDFPQKPESILSLVDNEKITLWWSKSEGIGDISYLILRNTDSIDTVIDTFFYDYSIDPDISYEYSIYSMNKVGLSIDGISTINSSWPAAESITKNRIVNIYPNPVNLLNNNLSVIIDIKNSNNSSEIILYDLNGREINKWNDIQLDQGRQRIELTNVGFLPVSSGLYFISNNNQSIPIIIFN